MIRINLLHRDSRRRFSAAARFTSLPWMKIAWGFIVCVVVSSGVVALYNQMEARHLSHLTAEYKRLEPQRITVAHVQQKLAVLRGRENTWRSLKAPQGRWAPRMEMLLDGLVANLWFKALVFQMSPSGETKKLMMMDEFRDAIPNIAGMLPPEEKEEPVQTTAASFKPSAGRRRTGKEAPVPVPVWKPRLWLAGAALVTGRDQAAPITRFIQRLKEQPEFSRWFTGLELKEIVHSESSSYEVSDFVVILYPKVDS